MSFKKINNITGWVICAIACLVYILTAEASGSFWDTGEFIASAYKLQLPHPPGAPLFTLIGRFFIILFGADNPAFAVNIMSAVARGFTGRIFISPLVSSGGGFFFGLSAGMRLK